ncbi:unnamed protein product [Didymodactylos carnosus]|uniref:Uncharacterized protein n=1 Tax=Didymodactylos carnosus TaxID=1234261 RepID=A0A8S2DW70_9BILA|nr:unnamed protein product [Didymodactylos carnosus]CAF3793037.1 unnamed protein product [Didymodactylos carnosus]
MCRGQIWLTVREKGWSEYPGLSTGEVFQRRFKAFVAKGLGSKDNYDELRGEDTYTYIIERNDDGDTELKIQMPIRKSSKNNRENDERKRMQTRLLLNRRGTIEHVVNYAISYWKENGRPISNNECSKKINETHWIVRDKIGYLLTAIAQLELIKLKRDEDTEQQTATQAKRKTTAATNDPDSESSDDDIDALPTTKRQRPKQNPLKDDATDLNIVTPTKRRRTPAVVPRAAGNQQYPALSASGDSSSKQKIRLFEVEVEEPVEDPTTNHMMNNDKENENRTLAVDPRAVRKQQHQPLSGSGDASYSALPLIGTEKNKRLKLSREAEQLKDSLSTEVIGKRKRY